MESKENGGSAATALMMTFAAAAVGIQHTASANTITFDDMAVGFYTVDGQYQPDFEPGTTSTSFGTTQTSYNDPFFSSASFPPFNTVTTTSDGVAFTIFSSILDNGSFRIPPALAPDGASTPATGNLLILEGQGSSVYFKLEPTTPTTSISFDIWTPTPSSGGPFLYPGNGDGTLTTAEILNPGQLFANTGSPATYTAADGTTTSQLYVPVLESYSFLPEGEEVPVTWEMLKTRIEITSDDLSRVHLRASNTEIWLDNITIVPEPTSLALLGLGGLIMPRRRR